MNPLKLLINFLFPKRKRVAHMEIDPESVRIHHTIRRLAEENASLKGQLAKLEVEEGKRREREEDKEEEKNVRIFLDKEKKKIMRKTSPDCFLLRPFYNWIIHSKKFRNRLNITSFDRSKNFGRFGDIGFCSDGDFVILDANKNVVLKMKTLNDVFQSVGGLYNDVRSFKIPVNLDGNGGYIENIMVYEAPELIKEGSKMRFAKARKKPVYDIIREKDAQIMDLQLNLEEEEATNIELQNKMNDLERGNRINENSAETARTELSKAEERATAVERAFRSLEQELIKLRQVKAISEDYVDKLEGELEDMRKKAEREGVKLADARAMELIRNIRSELAREIPEKEYIPVEAPRPQTQQKV